MGNRGCQIPGDFLLVSQRDWLQITESLSFHLWERKIDSFEMEKKKKINHHKCWKRPRVFLKRLPENAIVTKIYTKRAHGRQETFMICSFASFYCMTHLTQVARYGRKVKLVISEVMIQFSHSFIYFEVGHRQIFPGLEISSFPKARKSWNMQFGHTRRAPKYPIFSLFSHHLCILSSSCLEEGKEEG